MSLVNKKGVDIGDHNGDIDLAAVKRAGFDFVMIKCGYGSDWTNQDDHQFEANVRKAERLGMPWGAWLYSYALNEDQARSELAHILRLLKDKKPTMPIALDVEDSDGYRAKNGGWNFQNVTACTRIVLNGLRAAGYYPLLYTGFEEIENYISEDVWKTVDLWFPHWASKCGYKGDNLGIWQYGGEINIIEDNSIPGVGVIDKNICYKDYPTIIKSGDYNGWAPANVLDVTGYKFLDRSTGVLALKEMLLIARKLGITTQGMDENGTFGDGTQIAVNQVLKKGGYEQNGIAGDNFIKYLAKLIKQKF